MDTPLVFKVTALGPPPWPTVDPFLFCVHHRDDYPRGDEQLAPVASLAGRNIGMDFANKDGWNMYHGDTVPGFPRHPHRGFETVTLARRGYIDHSDSLGATARFGHGDVQWMTAGRGIVHAEMFPLVEREAPNPTELFQIWLNLPRADKMVEPHFSMLWSETIPRLQLTDEDGRAVKIAVIAGSLEGRTPPSPPPHSWASQPDSEVAIWTIELAPGARVTLPAASPGVHRTIYFFRGRTLRVAGVEVPLAHLARVRPDRPLSLENGTEPGEALVLQGRPIAEPTVQHGPFVMNTRAEINQAIMDYRRTQFGGWPWRRDDPVHPREEGRFAVHADGRTQRPA